MSIRVAPLPSHRPSAPKMTVAEFLARYGDSDERVELWNGTVVEMSPRPGDEHGVVMMTVGYLLQRYLDTHPVGVVRGGDFGVILPDDSLMGPDVAVALTRPGEHPAKGHRTRTPELIVEVVSPNDRHTQVVVKAERWRAGGARIVWVIDPGARNVHVYTATGVQSLHEGDTLNGGDVLPDLAIAVSDVFSRIAPA